MEIDRGRLCPFKRTMGREEAAAAGEAPPPAVWWRMAGLHTGRLRWAGGRLRRAWARCAEHRRRRRLPSWRESQTFSGRPPRNRQPPQIPVGEGRRRPPHPGGRWWRCPSRSQIPPGGAPPRPRPKPRTFQIRPGRAFCFRPARTFCFRWAGCAGGRWKRPVGTKLTRPSPRASRGWDAGMPRWAFSALPSFPVAFPSSPPKETTPPRHCSILFLGTVRRRLWR
mmetsp:Transcript_21999/g.70995  ORF Transcript_21999/g.70995 Transcript_21999/m.70995 type:complete len:224 (-) Transcript_21999:468-1139(-)